MRGASRLGGGRGRGVAAGKTWRSDSTDLIREPSQMDALCRAYELLQAARHGQPGVELQGLCEQVRASLGQLNDGGVIQIRRDECSALPLLRFWRWMRGHRDLRTDAIPVADLAPLTRRLLACLNLATEEIQRLCTADATVALNSLGYALHFIPELIREGRPFDPELFRFCLRIAAYRWSELSAPMQAMLAELAAMDKAEVDALACESGFAIDMFGHGRRKRTS
jgi:hypothetical protein